MDGLRKVWIGESRKSGAALFQTVDLKRRDDFVNAVHSLRSKKGEVNVASHSRSIWPADEKRSRSSLNLDTDRCRD